MRTTNALGFASSLSIITEVESSTRFLFLSNLSSDSYEGDGAGDTGEN